MAIIGPTEGQMDLAHALQEFFAGASDNTTRQTISADIFWKSYNSGNASGNDVIHASRISRTAAEVVALVAAYAVVIICSLLGNALVCFVIYKRRRLHTVTNMFITNLAISDILITVLNIPFSITRNVLENWPFGGFMCRFVNIILMMSVYVSTFTMTAIAMDRYIVIVYPLRPRLTIYFGIIIIIVTWCMSTLMSLPFALYAQVETLHLLLNTVTRCRLCYPAPADLHEKAITLFTLISQYVIPMAVTGYAYGHIVRKLWARELVGQPSANQRLSHQKARRKTIKMLITVVAIFCVCWMPLNMYHLLTDFHPDSERFHHNSSVYLACHWFAMSSVCYNPFVYCWMNASFRSEIRNRLGCFYRRQSRVHPGTEVNGLLVRTDRVVRKPTASSSSASRSKVFRAKHAPHAKSCSDVQRESSPRSSESKPTINTSRACQTDCYSLKAYLLKKHHEKEFQTKRLPCLERDQLPPEDPLPRSQWV